MFDLTGHSVLIVESEVALFVGALQRAIDATGAQSLVMRHPPKADDRSHPFVFTGAVVNVEHQELVGGLNVPKLIYGTAAIPKRPGAIVDALAELLGKGWPRPRVLAA